MLKFILLKLRFVYVRYIIFCENVVCLERVCVPTVREGRSGNRNPAEPELQGMARVSPLGRPALPVRGRALRVWKNLEDTHLLRPHQVPSGL